MALRTKFIERVINARSAKMDGEVVQEAPVDLDHDLAEINEHIEAEENVHGALEKLENLKASMERFSEEGELPESAKFFAGMIYKDALKSGGLVVDEVSLESYAEEISLESVVDTIKRVWKTIFDFMAGLFKKVAGFFTKVEPQAEVVIKEAEETVKEVSDNESEKADVQITDETALLKLAKIGLVKSTGTWKIHGSITSTEFAAKVTDPRHSLDAIYGIFRSDARDVVSHLQSMITAASDGEYIHHIARNSRFVVINVAQQLKLHPVESLSDDETLHIPRYPAFGGYAVALVYNEDDENYMSNKEVTLIEYVPSELTEESIGVQELTKYLRSATRGLEQFKEYRKKISSSFNAYGDFLEKFDVEKLTDVYDEGDRSRAREYATSIRNWIKWCMDITSGPVVAKAYIGVINGIKTTSKILKDAVKE